MITATSLESSAATTGTGGGAAPNAFSELTSEEFVKIMFTELTNQDPLKPSDSSALLEQMSSLRSIQSDIELTKRLDSLVSQNQLAAAGSLLGQIVSGLTENNERVFGRVIGVSRTDSGPVLNLNNGYRVPFRLVDEMVDPSVFEQPPAPPDEEEDPPPAN
jgi:flagellar basal-body rod modification protein FlgD